MTAALFTTADHEHMALALQLARQGQYTTRPNPQVGCVLVQSGRVVGTGWHQRAGQGHAEVNALAAAGSAARGATAYVTLEPCSHHGKTPPCAEALIEAGVARVISAMTDPNPAVSGRGHARLHAAGIDVRSGLMTSTAEALNAGFIKRMRTGRPRVLLKSAMSLDGRVAMANGESQWITGPEARMDVQRLRARAGAIITGINTVLADDPALTVRPEQWPPVADNASDNASDNVFDTDGWHWPTSVMAPADVFQPLRVVLDTHLRISPQAALLQQPGSTLIITNNDDAATQAPLLAAGAEVLVAPEVGVTSATTTRAGAQRIDLDFVLQVLGERQVNDVMIEAGGVLAGSWLQARLVDEWVVYVAPKLMGHTAQPVLTLPGMNHMSDVLTLVANESRQVGQDMRLSWRFDER